MVADRTVTLRAQWLGRILRQLREGKGLTLKEVAEYLQRNTGTVGRFEQGVYPVRRIEAAAMLDLYGVHDEARREVVLQLAGEVWRTGWWESYAKDDIWGSTIDYVWLENRSHALRTFTTVTVPGLLQTEAYARGLFEVANKNLTPTEASRAVQLRMERKQVLDREDPLRVTAVLDEAAVRRPVGGPAVMAAQLRHLCAMAERPHVEIRVLPFDVGAHASPDGQFSLLTMAEPFPEVAHIESAAGSIYMEMDQVDQFIGRYDWLYHHSLGAEETAAFLAAREKDLA